MKSGVPVGSCQLNNYSGIRHRWTAVGVRRSPSKRCIVHAGNNRQMQVVFVTTEVTPWSKVGGLGDVMAALPAALAARGHRVMTVSPMYSDYCDVRDTGVRVPVRLPVDTQQQQQQQQDQQQRGTGQSQQDDQQQLAGQILPASQQLHQQGQKQQDLQPTAGLQHFQQQNQDWQQDHQQPHTAAAMCPDLQQRHCTTHQNLQQPGEINSAAVQSGESACAFQQQTGSPDAGWAAEDLSSGSYARYYMCCSAGVYRVFVDHPLYHGGASRGDGKPWPAAIISSYTHPAAAAADRAGPDLAAAASVLCQAALAAPLLLWGVSRGLDEATHGQQQQQQAQLQQAKQRCRQQDYQLQQQQREMQLLMQLLGLDNTIAEAAASVEKASDGCDVAAVLAAAAEWQQTQLALHLQYPQQIVAGLASPVLLGTTGSEVDSRWQVSDLLLPQRQPERADKPAAACANAPVLFIANDWPCGVLPLWLEAYRQKAQHWQQDSPQLQWLRQQQQEVFNQIKPQQQSQQEQQPTITSDGVDSVQVLLQTALEVCSRTGDSSSSSYASCDGTTSSSSSNRPCPVCDVFGNYAADYVNGTESNSPSAPQQQLLQELQQEWQLQHGSSSLLEQQATPAEHSLEDHLVRSQSSYGSSSSWSAAADAWLQDVGYESGSVFNAELSALVSAAVQAGRVPQQHLPELAALQSQLQQVLKQEQVLGEAINRLRTATVKVQVPQQQQQQQQQQNADHHPTSTSTQMTVHSHLTPGAAGEPAMPRAVPAPPLSHEQGLVLLQQMLGRQLADSKVVFAIHNFGYQGTFRGKSNFDRLGLPQHMLSAFIAPVAQAAVTAGKAAAQAAAAAASAVGSQLAALAEALQCLMPGADSSSSSNRIANAGLLSTVQQALLQAKAEELMRVGEASGGQGQPSQPSSQWQAVYATEHDDHHQQQPDVFGGDESVEIHWLQAGVSASDVAVTVSSTYAQQMLQGSWESNGMQPDHSGSSASMAALLANKQLRGILNGIDTQCWDPATDPLLPAAVRYSAANAAAGKAAAKQLLQRRLGLHVNQAAPMFAFIGRLTPQKGVDVILAAAPQLLRAQTTAQPAPAASSCSLLQQQRKVGSLDGAVAAPGLSSSCQSLTAAAAHAGPAPGGVDCGVGGVGGPQLVLLGSGEVWMEEVLGQLAGRYAGRAVGIVGFNEPLAHLILAAADVLLVPSRFEPCGLVALAGLRYGVVPIASATGGLADIVTGDVGYLVVNPGPEGDTAAFRQGVRDLGAAMQQVVQEYGSQEFAAKRAAAMAVDVSWDAPCDAWEQLLQQLLEEDVAAGIARDNNTGG